MKGRSFWLYSANNDFNVLHELIGCTFIIWLWVQSIKPLDLAFLACALILCFIVTVRQLRLGWQVTVANAFGIIVTVLTAVGPILMPGFVLPTIILAVLTALAVLFRTSNRVSGRTFACVCALPSLALLATAALK